MKFLCIFNKRELNGDLHAEEQLFSQNNPYVNPSTVISSKMEKTQSSHCILQVIEGNYTVAPSEYTSIPFPVLRDNIANEAV